MPDSGEKGVVDGSLKQSGDPCQICLQRRVLAAEKPLAQHPVKRMAAHGEDQFPILGRTGKTFQCDMPLQQQFRNPHQILQHDRMVL